MTDDTDDVGPADPDPWSGGAEGAPGGRSRRALVLGAVLGVAAVAAVVAVLGELGPTAVPTTRTSASVSSRPAPEQPSAVGEDAEAVCACLYEGIVEEIPFDRYEAVNEALVAEREADPEGDVELPDDFDAIRADCVEEVGLPPDTSTSASAGTSPPPTAPGASIGAGTTS
ncbi:MAG: hypothetical protein U5R31_03815 [Acidimicrobiia bacterium]|nr:hypothetical protein [Acidimicrobiia bacterium]